MAILNNNPLIGASGQSRGYQIQRSLRFNSADSTYLNRTPASDTSSNKKGTFSCWIKVSSNSGTNGGTLLGAADTYFYGQFYNETLYFGNDTVYLNTASVFRDFSAWYHVVFVFDTTLATANDRMQIWVNGVRQTVGSFNTQPSQNSNFKFLNTAQAYEIGRRPAGSYFNGYMADINFIDGQALTPSSFGETDADTGVWKPKAYSGSYGTNGFYLKFADNSGTTSTTLGKDSSGNGNNWTPNNFSVTAGKGNDSLVDTPTPYGTDTGAGGEVRGNYATISPINGVGTALTITNGNLDYSRGTAAYGLNIGTISIKDKTYFEVTIGTLGGTANTYIGVGSKGSANDYYVTDAFGRDSFAWSLGVAVSTAYIGNNNSFASQSGTVSAGDVFMCAVDPANGRIWFGRNGTWYAGSPSAGTGASFTNLPSEVFPVVQAYDSGGATAHSTNFGQRAFAYTAPSGYKALCTTNLPTPTIGATSTTQAGKYFNPVIYTGTSANQSVAVGFQPDMVWIKSRSNTTNHALFDAVRGADKWLLPNATNAESSIGLFPSFDSNGFTVSNVSNNYDATNYNNYTYVSWNWKANGAGSSNTSGSITSTVSANTTAGFSIVTATTPASYTSYTVGHGLGATPAMLIYKERTGTSNWQVWHKNLSAASNAIQLNTTGAEQSGAYFGTQTSTVAAFQSGVQTGLSTTFVVYCFAPVAGYSAFGSYTGNGSTDGTFVYTGFRPAWVMLKCTNAAGNSWVIEDNKRPAYNPADYLLANSSGAEGSGASVMPIAALSAGEARRSQLAGY